MNLGFLIYYIDLIDRFKTALTLFTIIYSILFIVVIISKFLVRIDKNFFDTNTMNTFFKKIKLKLYTVLFILLISMCIFIPNSLTISAIYLIPKIAKNEQLQKIPNKVLQLLNNKLDEWIENSIKEKE